MAYFGDVLHLVKQFIDPTQANEIAFINTLEAQNKRHDIMSKHQECEARLLDLQVIHRKVQIRSFYSSPLLHTHVPHLHIPD